jgi:hypothetical protein
MEATKSLKCPYYLIRDTCPSRVNSEIFFIAPSDGCPAIANLLSLDASLAIPTLVLRFEVSELRQRTSVRPVLLTRQTGTHRSEKVESKDSYKHKSMTDGKYRSRHDHEHKHKSKYKDEQRSRKKESRGKARAMVGASDVDSSPAYSTSSSSSSEDEGDRRKSRKSSKNLSGLSYFARDGFCTMALSSGSKKSNQSDSDSDSDDEVRDELPFLRQKNNERLGLLLDNRDDILREAKKMRKDLRASLQDARTIVAELETRNLDAKLEIDFLKASHVVFDEVECANCPIFLTDFAMFKGKHASKCEKLDVLRVEVVELKSRPALLDSCTSCLFCIEKLMICMLTLFLLSLS